MGGGIVSKGPPSAGLRFCCGGRFQAPSRPPGLTFARRGCGAAVGRPGAGKRDIPAGPGRDGGRNAPGGRQEPFSGGFGPPGHLREGLRGALRASGGLSGGTGADGRAGWVYGLTARWSSVIGSSVSAGIRKNRMMMAADRG